MAKRDVGYVVINTFIIRREFTVILNPILHWHKKDGNLIKPLTIEKSCYMSANPTTASLLWSQN